MNTSIFNEVHQLATMLAEAKEAYKTEKADCVDCKKLDEPCKDCKKCEGTGYLKEATTAAAGRASEREWLASLGGDVQTSKKDSVKKDAHMMKGDKVIAKGGIGYVVDVDQKDKQVIIKQGDKETVYKMSDFGAPKQVGKHMVWSKT